jgi:hypothetical protein
VTAGSTDWCCINLTPSLPLLLIQQGSGRVGQVRVALPLDLMEAHLAAAVVVVAAVAAVAAAVAAAAVVIGGK